MGTITNYNELLTELQTEFSRSDTNDKAPRAIQTLESELNRRLRVLDMQETTTLTTVGGTSTVNLPSDFREARSITNASDPTSINSMSLEQLISLYGTAATGTPRYFSVLNGKLRFAPIPDTAYTINLIYYQDIPALTSLNTTNWLISKHPDLYLYGTYEKMAMIYRDMANRDYYRAIKEQLIQEITKEDQSAKMSESTPAIRPDVSIV